jgi:predicted house-cleaning NTP pyrophosphatase (Maf/HAM1 superfamily)
MAKYALVATDRVVEDGVALSRVRRLSDGVLGGYIEAERNLDQAGNCFVHEFGRVLGDATVKDNAQVFGKLSGSAIVADDAQLYGIAKDFAEVKGAQWFED